jgi:hypothetical protein
MLRMRVDKSTPIEPQPTAIRFYLGKRKVKPNWLKNEEKL